MLPNDSGILSFESLVTTQQVFTPLPPQLLILDDPQLCPGSSGGEGSGKCRLHAHFFCSFIFTQIKGLRSGVITLDWIVAGKRRFHEWPDKYISLNEFIGILTILS